MVKGSKGPQRGTRRKLRKSPRERGKFKLGRVLQRFGLGDTVSIKIDPTFQNFPHPRFHGKTGVVVGFQGRACFVEIKDGGKQKRVLVTPEHLVK